jgi:hypothetical protein
MWYAYSSTFFLASWMAARHVTCITIIDTIIHHILTKYTNNAYTTILYTQVRVVPSSSLAGWPPDRLHLHPPLTPSQAGSYLYMCVVSVVS